ncbi:MAG: HAD family hydrolase, partial [Planktomarina sp.]
MTQIEAVIFDKDGTLFDFQATWGHWTGTVLDQLCGDDLALKSRVAEDLYYDLVGRKILPNSIVVAATPLEIATHMGAHFPQYSVNDLMHTLNDLAENSPQVMVTDLTKFCASLRTRRIKLAVMTNDAERPAKAHLKAAGALAAFDFVIGSDSGYGGKPSAAPLLALSDMLGVAAGNCVMVGDSTHDLISGQAAGMKTV